MKLQKENKLYKLCMYFCLLSFILYIFNFLWYIFNKSTFHYLDGDSYYFLALTKHLIHPTLNVLDYSAYYLGEYQTIIFLFLLSILTAIMISDGITENKLLGCCLGLLWLWLPINFFMNGWFGILDKNIITSFLFVIFCGLMLYEGKDLQINKKVKVWKITKLFDALIKDDYIKFIGLFIFYFFAQFFWQGSEIFLFYGVVWMIINKIYETKSYKYVIALISCFIISFIIFPKDYFFISQLGINLLHLLLPDFWICIGLLLMIKVDYKEQSFIALGIILFALCPRLNMFLGVLIIYQLAILYEQNVKHFNWMIVLIVLASIILIPSYVNTYKIDPYESIKEAPCHNCTILGSWDKGWIYLYKWNETIMFKGHPNIEEELQYNYYKNKTCNNCHIYLQEDDYKKYKLYLQIK